MQPTRQKYKENLIILPTFGGIFPVMEKFESADSFFLIIYKGVNCVINVIDVYEHYSF